MKQLLLFLVGLIAISATGQVITSNKKYPDPVILSFEYYYYGLDMSLCTLTQPDKVYYGAEYRDSYGQAFVDEYARFVPFKTLTKWLQKGRVFYHPYEVQQLWRKLPDNWINEVYVPVTEEQIHEHIKTYEISAKEGMGFTVIPVNFDKKTEKVLVYFVFFDIKTRDLLWVSLVKGSAFGSGIAPHWIAGVEHATRLFVDKDYKITAAKLKK